MNRKTRDKLKNTSLHLRLLKVLCALRKINIANLSFRKPALVEYLESIALDAGTRKIGSRHCQSFAKMSSKTRRFFNKKVMLRSEGPF